LLCEKPRVDKKRMAIANTFFIILILN